ncbi:MAG TPA: carboxypeptidase-like regulatory domain-containing protein [Gemmatimonadaceae bacterium]|nr:carboxypeptidase-like regulatory domain-containing protein [Gemmatimonadaceae bacterium]
MRPTHWLPIAALAIALGARGGVAQTVRGTLVDDATGRALGGAIVALLDEKGTTLRRTFTDDDGAFALSAAGAGRYTLRAQRIGFRSTTTPPFDLGAGERKEMRVVAAAVPVRLAEVRTTAERRCTVRPEEGLGVQTLWEEARKALDATALAQEERRLEVRIAQYARDLDPRSLAVSAEQRSERTGVSESPFVSLPASELAANGYVQQRADGTWYYAPDAAVLVSDAFLDGHCFRVREGGAGEGEGLIGLAFEPVKAEHADIQGVLWLDERSSELRNIEYGYTGVALPRSKAPFGGRIEFRRMPSGAWIVSRWWIRMPVTATVIGPARTDGSITHFPGTAPAPTARESLRAIHEEGGEVVSAVAVAERARRSGGAIAGVATDSTRGAPLAGARVVLRGTALAAVTDSAGRYRLTGVPPGSYTVALEHARLDSLGRVRASRAVTVLAGQEAAADLAIPSWPSLAAALCPDSLRGPGRAALVGVVRRADDGEPAARAVVSASWTEPAAGGARRAVARRADVAADEEGAYRLCGLPVGAELRLRAMVGALASGPVRHPPSSDAVSAHDLIVQAPVAAAAEKPTVLPATEVKAARALTADAGGFEMRRRRGQGYFVDRTVIDQRKPLRVSDILRNVPGIRFEMVDGRWTPYFASSARRFRDPSLLKLDPQAAGRQRRDSITSQGGAAPPDSIAKGPLDRCPILYYIDGQRHEATDLSIDDYVRPEELEAMEVYRGTAEVPVRFQSRGSDCGVVVIWTRRQ